MVFSAEYTPHTMVQPLPRYGGSEVLPTTEPSVDADSEERVNLADTEIQEALAQAALQQNTYELS